MSKSTTRAALGQAERSLGFGRLRVCATFGPDEIRKEALERLKLRKKKS